MTVRRVKCDETKPQCKRCTNTGRKCDGYRVVGSSQGQQPSSDEPTPAADTLVLTQANPAWTIAGTDEERRSFEFFRCRTSVELSGFFKTGFWNRVVLQAAHCEPAIRHAVLGLSSLHERFEVGDKSILSPTWDSSEGGFALQQYNQAIQQLIKPDHQGQQPVDVCLMACMLFASFETLRGHHRTAMSHIKAGVKILSEIQFRNGEHVPTYGCLTISPHPFVELAHLEVLFNRLDSQVVAMLGTRPMTLDRVRKDNAPGFHSNLPTCFTNLEEARNSFDYHWNGCLLLFNDIGIVRGPNDNPERIKTYEDNRQRYLLIFKHWEASFELFLHKHGDQFDLQSWQGARVLQIMHIFVSTNLEASPYLGVGKETTWDQYLSNYERATVLAEQVINTVLREQQSSRLPVPSFSLDMALVGPLYSIAHKCRHPVVRRKAVALLYAAPRQEGIWDSFLAARVAEKLISLEESGLGPVRCCEDVPDEARLNAVDVSFDHSGRQGTMIYSRVATPHQPRRRDYIEMLEW